tara:strand:- start:43 stop:405 length:363 start_codon:yes stop_codon:yes gene_type:complete
MRPSLFDQLYYNIDLGTSSKAEAPTQPAMTPAQRTPTTDEAGLEQQKAPKEFTGMKFTHSLIKHLDQLYSKMLAGDVKEIASEPEYDSKQKVIEGQTGALVLNEKEAFYNPGNSAVTESM